MNTTVLIFLNKILQISKPVLLVLILLLVSCEEPYEVELDSTWRRLAVEGLITTDTMSHYVRLTKSADYFSSAPAEGISGALVSVTDGEEMVYLTESDSLAGLYLTDGDFSAKENTSYTLTMQGLDIDNDGVTEDYYAVTSAAEIPSPDSIQLEPFNYSGYVSGHYIRLFMQDPPKPNFYLFRVLINNQLITDTIDEVMYTSDEMFNGNYLYGVRVATLIDMEEDERLVSGDTITLEVICVDENYYRFIVELGRTLAFQNPLFGGPPANPITNVKPGHNAVGYFGAYSIARVHRVYKL
jgi:hypothetical protein